MSKLNKIISSNTLRLQNLVNFRDNEEKITSFIKSLGGKKIKTISEKNHFFAIDFELKEQNHSKEELRHKITKFLHDLNIYPELISLGKYDGLIHLIR